MKRLVIVLAGLVMAGCIARPKVAPIEIAAPARYLDDVGQCQAAAAAYQPNITVVSVLYGAVAQSLNVISYAVLYPWMPALGAIGGAGKVATDAYDLTGRIRANVFRHCMADKVARDHSAIIANPED